jgi:hypothetical protein
VTLGVDDLERALTFHSECLGFPTEGIVGREFKFGALVVHRRINPLQGCVRQAHNQPWALAL